MSRAAWFAGVALLFAGAYFVVLYFVQRSLLFPVPARTPADPGARAEIVRIPMFDTEAVALFLAADAAGPSPLIIFTHGNGELADDWLHEFEPPRRLGMSVLLVEYPGYGRAAGSPSEKAIVDTVHAAHGWAAADPRVDPSRIVAYGRSLGGAAAARLAADRRVAALILESTPASVADLAANLLAPSFLVRDPFDTRAALRSYRGPLLVIHGRQDSLVPVTHGRELASLVPGAKLMEIECGHNDCPRQWDAIEMFLREAAIHRRKEGSKD